MRPLIHICVTTGHLPSYQAVFVRLFDGVPSTGRLRGPTFWRLVRAERVFFCTIDTDYKAFVAIAVLRALRGHRTTGLFLRPMQCFRKERPVVYSAKRWVFRVLRRLPGLRLLSIIPFAVEPRLAQVCHDWIHDPQLWDLWLDGPPVLPETDLSQRVTKAAGGRDVMIFIGAGNSIKGFDAFVDEALSQKDSVLAVVAGRVASDFALEAQRLVAEGMIVEDRFVSDEEILSLYKVADRAWCRYAPDYDQASGIFGRAVQTGVTPIVREGSVVANLWQTLSDQKPEEMTLLSKETLQRQWLLHR
jgi:hypothetical protein